MVKNTKQIALIQHRRGKLSELPKQLNEGEFGLALDTNELFIGNSTNPALAERIESNTFPYGNIQILTEFTDNLQKIIYRYKSNTDIKARLPIVIKGTAPTPSIPQESSIKINGVEIRFEVPKSNIYEIIQIINDGLPSTVKAFTDDGVYISFISTDSSLTLEDGYTPQITNIGMVERLGFGVNSFTEVSSLPPERTLQEVLDDTVSIKSFGALGDASTTDDGEAIFNAIISLNKAGNDSKYFRTLFFPSGTYLTNKVIPLPYGTHLKGEGIRRTVIKSDGLDTSLMVAMDGNMNLATAGNYGMNTDTSKYVTVEDMTIDVSGSHSASILTLSACQNFVFRNVEFIGNDGSTSVIIEDSTNVSNTLHVLFDSCIFTKGHIGIYSTSNVEHLVVKNCIFEDIDRNSIWLDPADEKVILNSIIEGNYFRNCGENFNEPSSIIHLGERTRYISTVNNRFDENDSTYTTAQAYETLSNLNYTDILDPNTDTKKLLQFNFTQPQWAYVDYLTNPNGEYLLRTEYNKELIDNEEVVRALTNGIILRQGDNSNDNTVTLETSSKYGNLSITSGLYGTLDLGDDTGMEYEEEWMKIPYEIGDIVQVSHDNTYSIYECIRKITTTDIDNGRDVEPHGDSQYWRLIGVFNPVIYLSKPTDLSGNFLTDTEGNLTFKTAENNYLVIDDSNNTTSYSYAERIATDKNAVPNIDYVNTIAQTTVRKKFNFTTIQNVGTNKQEIVYFDPNVYGGFINLNFINVNIRRPFYPIQEHKDSALEWQTGLKYYAGDVIKTLTDDIADSTFTFKIGDGISWGEDISSQFLHPTIENMDGNGLPSDSYPNSSLEDKYAEFRDNTERNLFYKHNGHWYQIGSENWKDLYPSKITATPESTNYPQDSTFSIINRVRNSRTGDYDYETYTITLTSEPSVANFIHDVTTATYPDGDTETNICEHLGITVTLDNGAICFEQQHLDKCVLKLADGYGSPLSILGFEFDMFTGYATVQSAELIKSYDNVKTYDASDYMLGSVWVKSTGKEEWFTCIYENIASDSFNQDLGKDGSIAKWIAINATDINKDPLKDLKYLSILAQADDTVDDETEELKENEQRLLFLKNVIEADRRDFHSIYEENFNANKTYNVGERCLYAGRYWECLKQNKPGTKGAYALHDPDLWLAVPEEGFNYHFDFERDLYLLDEEGNIVTSDDVVLDYNFANYHFFLMFYDKDQKLLVPYPVDYDTSGLTYKGSIDSDSQLPETGEQNDYYIVGPEKLIFYWDEDMWKPLEPYTYLCVSPAGNIAVTINYLRGQGDDWDED